MEVDTGTVAEAVEDSRVWGVQAQRCRACQQSLCSAKHKIFFLASFSFFEIFPVVNMPECYMYTHCCYR